MFNININKMINSIISRIKTSGGTLNLGHLPLTQGAERILRNSYNEASIEEGRFQMMTLPSCYA